MFKNGNMLNDVRIEKSDFFPNYFEVWEHGRDMYFVHQDYIVRMYPHRVQDEQCPPHLKKF